MNTTLFMIALFAIGAAFSAIGLAMMYAHRDHMTIARQHIADLELLLSNLIDARDELNAEIDGTTRRLLEANAQLDAKTLCRHQTVRANWIDREFQDLVPHTY